jgi:hypothetical protein
MYGWCGCPLSVRVCVCVLTLEQGEGEGGPAERLLRPIDLVLGGCGRCGHGAAKHLHARLRH